MLPGAQLDQGFGKPTVCQPRESAGQDAGEKADHQTPAVALEFTERIKRGVDKGEHGRRGRGHEGPDQEAEKPREEAHEGPRPGAQQDSGDDDRKHGEGRHHRADGQAAERREAEYRLNREQHGELNEKQDLFAAQGFVLDFLQ